MCNFVCNFVSNCCTHFFVQFCAILSVDLCNCMQFCILCVFICRCVQFFLDNFTDVYYCSTDTFIVRLGTFLLFIFYSVYLCFLSRIYLFFLFFRLISYSFQLFRSFNPFLTIFFFWFFIIFFCLFFITKFLTPPKTKNLKKLNIAIKSRHNSYPKKMNWTSQSISFEFWSILVSLFFPRKDCLCANSLDISLFISSISCSCALSCSKSFSAASASVMSLKEPKRIRYLFFDDVLTTFEHTLWVLRFLGEVINPFPIL